MFLKNQRHRVNIIYGYQGYHFNEGNRWLIDWLIGVNVILAVFQLYRGVNKFYILTWTPTRPLEIKQSLFYSIHLQTMNKYKSNKYILSLICSARMNFSEQSHIKCNAWNVMSGMWCLECNVWNVMSGMWCLECNVWNVMSGMWCLKCNVGNVMSGMWDVMRSPFSVKHVDDGMLLILTLPVV